MGKTEFPILAGTSGKAGLARGLQVLASSKITPMTVFLASDTAREVTGQAFAVRRNEIFLVRQPHPVRSRCRGEGRTARTIAEHGFPVLRAKLIPLETSRAVFCWNPV